MEFFSSKKTKQPTHFPTPQTPDLPLIIQPNESMANEFQQHTVSGLEPARREKEESNHGFPLTYQLAMKILQIALS